MEICRSFTWKYIHDGASINAFSSGRQSRETRQTNGATFRNHEGNRVLRNTKQTLYLRQKASVVLTTQFCIYGLTHCKHTQGLLIYLKNLKHIILERITSIAAIVTAKYLATTYVYVDQRHSLALVQIQPTNRYHSCMQTCIRNDSSRKSDYIRTNKIEFTKRLIIGKRESYGSRSREHSAPNRLCATGRIHTEVYCLIWDPSPAVRATFTRI
jgi:hypothetical protein